MKNNNSEIEETSETKKWNKKEIIQFVVPIILALVLFLSKEVLSYLNRDPEPKKIYSCFYKCEINDAIIYIGKIKNIEEGHIENLKLFGTLDSEIIDFTSDQDNETKISYNEPKGSVLLKIPRLTFGNECTFNIVTYKNSNIKKQFIVSWGHKGNSSLTLKPCDEKIKMGLDMGSRLQKLSHKARQTVIDRNDN